MSRKSIAAIGAIVLACGAAVAGISLWKADAIAPPDNLLRALLERERSLGPWDPSSSRIRVLFDEDHEPTFGNRDALVTIVVFDEFECPATQRIGPAIDDLVAARDDVRIVYKPFPLAQHPNAALAAEAALAAHAQGRYPAFRSRLLTTKQLAREDLEAHAEAVGLNMARFRAALDSRAYKPHVDMMRAYGGHLGVNYTPFLFVNGQRLEEATVEALEHTIEEERRLALTMKVPPAQVYATLMKDARVGGMLRSTDSDEPSFDYSKRYDIPVRDGDPALGPLDAPHTMIVFEDFQCPSCAAVQPVLEQFIADNGDEVRLIWKHFPLPNHAQAPLAHEASMAAHAQGKFREYRKLLYANQSHLDRASLDGFAEELSLDMAAFREALDTGRYRDEVEADVALATELDLPGTPTVFINGKPLEILLPHTLVAALDGEQDSAGGEPLPPRLPPEKVSVTIRDSDPMQGPADAPITVVMYADYESAACARLWQQLDEQMRAHPRALRVIIKQRPNEFHMRAERAARAALAGHAQGRFWEMHAVLLEHATRLGDVDLGDLAKAAGLDAAAFEAALDSEAVTQQLAAHLAEAEELVFRLAPVLVINDRVFRGARLEQRVAEQLQHLVVTAAR